MSVNIGNGDGDVYRTGDNVQTIVRWKPPELMAGIDDEKRKAILDEFEKGLGEGRRYSAVAQVKGDRAAWRVVKEHCREMTGEQCRDVVKEWLRLGVLVQDKYHDPVERKDLTGLSVGFRPPDEGF